jgi:DNA repair exonuclease SbcCD nuclease subunit
MKIIHTSDLHLASALSAKLPGAKAASRRRELLANLQRLCSTAMELGASAIIIAGDLFDTAKITRKELDTTLAIIERAENITFFYLPGNHDISSNRKGFPRANDDSAMVWKEFAGKNTYYSFIYKDVLFICKFMLKLWKILNIFSFSLIFI